MKTSMGLKLACGVCALACVTSGQALAEGDAPRLPKEDTPWFIERFDKDGDGKISDAEREVAREQMRERREKDRAAFDKDGDGKLSDEEKAAFKAAREERKQQMLKKFDADGDGQLSESERAAMREARQKGHKGQDGRKAKDTEDDKD